MPHTEETKIKISEGNKRAWVKGDKATEDNRKRLSQACLERNAGMIGRKHSEETKQKNKGLSCKSKVDEERTILLKIEILIVDKN